MNTRNVAVISLANILNIVLIVLAFLLSNGLYSVLSRMIYLRGEFTMAILCIFISSFVLFFPVTWALNKYVIKPDWSKLTYVKAVFQQNLTIVLVMVFLILAIISSSARHAEMAEPVILLIVTIFGLAANKIVLLMSKKK